MVSLILYYSYTKCDKVDRERLFVALILIAVQSVFWALFEQQGASLTLLTDQQFNLKFLGITFKASQVQLLNALFIVMLAPVMAWLWLFLARKNLEPSTPGKFGISLLIIGAGFMIFAWALTLDDTSNKDFIWLVFIYLMVTIAELFLSPVGLSMVTKLSVPKIVGMMMGTWFLFTALGSNLAGIISSLMGSDEQGAAAGALDMAATVELYTLIGIFSAGIGGLILLLTPIMKKWMHGVH
jgi:POT family proton-dependent oligopeptide transporter